MERMRSRIDWIKVGRHLRRTSGYGRGSRGLVMSSMIMTRGRLMGRLKRRCLVERSSTMFEWEQGHDARCICTCKCGSFMCSNTVQAISGCSGVSEQHQRPNHRSEFQVIAASRQNTVLFQYPNNRFRKPTSNLLSTLHFSTSFQCNGTSSLPSASFITLNRYLV